jgi:hypothetical protein
MSDAFVSTSEVVAIHAPREGTPRKPKTLPSITLKGKTWKPRKKVAAERGVSDATVRRQNYETLYIGNVAYVCEEDCEQELISQARRRR